MPQSLTYQLDLILNSSKPGDLRQEVKKHLMSLGFDSFVDGDISDIEIDYDWGHDENLVSYLGALQSASTITLYRYDENELLSLKKNLEDTFKTKLSTRMSSVKTEAWQEGWKDSFKPLHVNEFYIYPPWESKDAAPGEHSIMINPGMAFGTGSHATTQLCLKSFSHWLTQQRNTHSPQSFDVLDVGTGTGVLAIAAKLSGASTVVATDIDPDAMLALRENAHANAVEIFSVQGSVKEIENLENIPELYDVVFANILLPVITELFPDLIQKVKPGGVLIVSGIISDQEADVLSLADKSNFILNNRNLEGDWLALELKPRV